MRSPLTSRSNWAKEGDVEGQAPHRGGGIERLGDTDEGDIVPLERLDQFGEVHQRAGQPIDLVGDDDIDETVIDIGKKPPKGRTLQGAA